MSCKGVRGGRYTECELYVDGAVKAGVSYVAIKTLEHVVKTIYSFIISFKCFSLFLLNVIKAPLSLFLSLLSNVSFTLSRLPRRL